MPPDIRTRTKVTKAPNGAYGWEHTEEIMGDVDVAVTYADKALRTGDYLSAELGKRYGPGNYPPIQQEESAWLAPLTKTIPSMIAALQAVKGVGEFLHGCVPWRMCAYRGTSSAASEHSDSCPMQLVEIALAEVAGITTTGKEKPTDEGPQ